MSAQIFRHVSTIALVAAIAVGCNNDDVEPSARPDAPNAAQGIDAELVVSDLTPRAGSDVVVIVRLRRGAAVGHVASFTARVAYDTTRLQLIGEQQLDDGGTRMLNPAAGESRVAGIASAGFTSDELFGLQFKALSPTGLESLQVAFDEVHAVGGADLLNTIRVRHTLVPRTLR
jgi:hypothetical protein